MIFCGSSERLCTFGAPRQEQFLLPIITSGVVPPVTFLCPSFSHLCSERGCTEHFPEIPGFQDGELGSGAAKAAALPLLSSSSLQTKPAAGWWPRENKELLRRGWRIPVLCSSSGWGLLRQIMKPGVCHKMTHCQSYIEI